MSLSEVPGTKTLPRTLLFHAICHRGTCRVLQTHDNLHKPTPVKQVVVAAIVILNNICHAWTMYLFMDSLQFLLEASGASCFVGALLFGDKFQTHLGALLLGKALLIGTLQYFKW